MVSGTHEYRPVVAQRIVHLAACYPEDVVKAGVTIALNVFQASVIIPACPRGWRPDPQSRSRQRAGVGTACSYLFWARVNSALAPSDGFGQRSIIAGPPFKPREDELGNRLGRYRGPATGCQLPKG